MAKLAGLTESAATHVQILLFGDSVSERTSNMDTDTRPLLEMIGGMLPSSMNYYAVTHSAYYVDIYLLYLALLLELGVHVESVIVPVNVRSFSPSWDLNPMYRCGSHAGQLLTELHRRGVTRFDGYAPQVKSAAAFMNQQVRYPGVEFTRIAQFREVVSCIPKSEADKYNRKRIIFVFHYMSPPPNGHHQLRALSDMAGLCSQKAVGLLVYITPVNYRAGQRYVGGQFTQRLRTTVAMVSEALDCRGQTDRQVVFRDFSTLLDPQHFFSLDEASEHLNQLGRRILANHVLAAIDR